MAMPVQASGIFLQEAVVANAGTVGAGDGVYTGSAAAMWTNPATMSFMGESLTTINVALFDLEMKFKHTGPGSDASDAGNGKASTLSPTLGFFHARQINDQTHVGISVGVAGGSALDYGTNWAGTALLNDIDLAVAQINPTVSYQYNDQWSFGAGVQMSWASLEQTMGAGTIRVEESSDWAFGFTLGTMYRYSEDLDLSLSYRSKVEHSFDADVSGAVQGGVAADIDVPAIVDASMRYGINADLNLLASVQFHRWSEWDHTVFNFNNGGSLPIQRDWDDVWHFAVGTDYRLNDDWRLKAGLSYETSPQDDPQMQWVDLPVGDQWRYSVGASTVWNGYTFDMFYEYADLGSVKSEARVDPAFIGVNGQFDGRIHFIGLNVSF
ncbi:outer membrane beta-barrel protein [Vibrio astriarenae]|uniref:Outer membrane beta-barrel protein n=2 Tax=Vibrio astriarenae TaxID=1481923 RepID=A0A7Z2T8H3_9VIBR|nr:outer membrane beta-barrel protein [Vibrio astriarenae]